MTSTCSFTGRLWRAEDQPGASEGGAWHFVTVPAEPSEDIRDETEGRTRGFGSVRVQVRIGTTTWRTSVFPNARSGCYVLPVKKAVRRAEDVEAGEDVTVELTVLEEA